MTDHATARSALDTLLGMVDLRCTVYHNQQLCGNWELAEHEIGQTCFHLVSHGECELSWGGRHWSLAKGDLVLFPAEQPHQLRTLEPQERPMQTFGMEQPLQSGHTGLLCASVTFAHQASRALLEALPEMTLLRRDPGNDPWLNPLLQQVLWESQHPAPGQAAVLDQLAELIFMQAIRHQRTDDATPAGLLGALRDPGLARAMTRFQARPEHPWTLSELAAEAAMSRSRFANHFRRISGWTPARYMAWWRMQLAWTHLSRGTSVLATALQVGYQSEAAFSRAFRATFGVSAGAVRRQLNTV
ncbi:AraC family transcriptional regulator [Natronospirillum operosum]|uniref:AraC family transcriptional regulator n=1 Tax=Natronospirillum operosum TaxID=2759953 RepID=A0A4Z0W696_9GAMM|nr:AraC family transcriptional regulator [Natronospirillum operosum]TGG93314.1 AraC family transcriptional regulator [Natronospirillum operosum]